MRNKTKRKRSADIRCHRCRRRVADLLPCRSLGHDAAQVIALLFDEINGRTYCNGCALHIEFATSR